MPKIRRKPVDWTLECVISGGQIGADIAGVRAAKLAGIKTGGNMPLGFITLDGMKPEYREEFGMREAVTGSYRTRTELNVRDSDGTIRIAYRWHSPGELCTLRAINWFEKPYLDIDPANPLKPRAVALWLRSKQIKVLNVAGNADTFLETFVESYLREVFKCLRAE